MDCPRPRATSTRLHKYLAHCGVASRRACETLIEQGRVSVDGQVVTQQGVCIDPAVNRIEVDGRPVAREQAVHILLNKPRDYVCTMHDPQGRATYRDLLQGIDARVYSVGRLDQDSEGLLILTNDGELAHELAHPRHHVEKIYRVWADGALSAEQIARMTGEGVMSDGERLQAAEISELRESGAGVQYRVVLREGRNRQIRRMFAAFSLRVIRLQRVGIGPLRLGALRPGEWRHLSPGEVDGLRAAVQARRRVVESARNRDVEENGHDT